mgnify:CR=1 FL=1
MAMSRNVLGHSDTSLVSTAVSVLGEHGGLEDLGRLLSPKLRQKVRTRGLRAAASVIGRSEKGGAQDQAMARMSATLVGLLGDLDFRARQTAVSLLASVGDKSAISHLEAFRRVETVASLSESARQAVKDIRSRSGEVAAPGKENQRDAQLKDLEERIKELESQMRAWNDKH